MIEIKKIIATKKIKMKLKEKISEHLKSALISRDEIIFCYIHGSFLDKFPFRDIDVAIYIDQEKISSKEVFEYSFQLSLDLTQKIGKEIDIQILNHASLGFKHSVLKNGEILFSKDENLRLNLIESISLEYIDFYELSLQYIRELVY